MERTFGKLSRAGYEKTSEFTGYPPNDGAYNCIAWAASDPHHFWWPQPDVDWPIWAKRVTSIPAFVEAFKWLGYRVCKDSRLQFGYEKVALYAIGSDPKHMARQLRDGRWTSKCGGAEDITHFTLDALESYGPPPQGQYGRPVLYMRRPIPLGWFVRFIQWLEWQTESRLWERLGAFLWKEP